MEATHSACKTYGLLPHSRVRASHVIVFFVLSFFYLPWPFAPKHLVAIWDRAVSSPLGGFKSGEHIFSEYEQSWSNFLNS